jgi:hypothetical protein
MADGDPVVGEGIARPDDPVHAAARASATRIVASGPRMRGALVRSELVVTLPLTPRKSDRFGPAALHWRSMIKAWRVRLELARDDDGVLDDEGIDALTEMLAKEHVRPELSHGDRGTVLVQMTIDARDDMAAKSAAEGVLRQAANSVWSARGLPPFTIAFVDALESPREAPRAVEQAQE